MIPDTKRNKRLRIKPAEERELLRKDGFNRLEENIKEEELDSEWFFKSIKAPFFDYRLLHLF